MIRCYHSSKSTLLSDWPIVGPVKHYISTLTDAPNSLCYLVQLQTYVEDVSAWKSVIRSAGRSCSYVLVTSSPGVMRSALSRGSHPYSSLRIGYVNFYCKRMSASGRSHYRGSLPVICFRRTTSWASSRAVNVCVCARVIYIERCCHVCAVCSHTYVKELHSTWQHGTDSGRFLSPQGYLRAKVYVLQVG